MSHTVIDTIKCPCCNKESSFNFIDSFDGATETQLKKDLINYTIFDHKCPKCNEMITINSDLWYRDSKKKYQIYYINKASNLDFTIKSLITKDDNGESAVSKIEKEGYKFRIVTDVESLIEKVLAFDDDLDDRALEFTKLVIRSDVETNQPDVKFERCLYLVGNDSETREIAFINSNDQVIGTIPFDRNNYEMIYTNLFKNKTYPNEDKNVINTNWVINNFLPEASK